MVAIVDQLRALAVPIGNVELDPDNARRGDVPAVRRSLSVFGQRKPIVAKTTGKDKQGRGVGIVIAGNHTLRAARELGWDEIAVVFVADDATTAKAYALADNRTGDLATWDGEQLSANLAELTASHDFTDMAALGWTDGELAALLGAASDLTEFRAYDETTADDVQTITCPNCAHVFPR